MHPRPRWFGVSVVIDTVCEADETIRIRSVRVLSVLTTPVPEGVMYVLQYGRGYYTDYKVSDEGQSILQSGQYRKRMKSDVSSKS